MNFASLSIDLNPKTFPQVWTVLIPTAKVPVRLPQRDGAASGHPAPQQLPEERLPTLLPLRGGQGDTVRQEGEDRECGGVLCGGRSRSISHLYRR